MGYARRLVLGARTNEDLSSYICNVCDFLETNYCMPTQWLTGPFQKSFPPWLKPLVTPLIVGGGTFRLTPGGTSPCRVPDSIARVVQDCEHEGPHYGLKKNLRAAKRETQLQLKDSFVVLINLIFAARLTQFFSLE